MLLPPCIYGPVDKWSKSSPFHGGVPGSNPGRVTKEKQKFLCKTNVRSADLKAISRCYQRPGITHREGTSDPEGTMCYANGSSKWHTPAYNNIVCSLEERAELPLYVGSSQEERRYPYR